MFGHVTYLIFELSWGLPVLALQWAVGRRPLWKKRAVLLVALIVPTVYLSCTDAVAIASGIWTLHGDRIVGFKFGNVPIEETLFFLLTNAMVVQSVILADGWRREREASRPA